MGKSWNAIRKELEEDLLCEELRGRVQFFFTIYHKAPDQYGRFAIRVDGKEVFRANPYNEKYCDENLRRIREERNVPMRQWDEKGVSYEAENEAIEEEARLAAIREGHGDSFDVMRSLQAYLNQEISKSLWSADYVLRMFAVMDRRVGKRTLEKLVDSYEDLPDWLKVFYELRFAAAGILSKNKAMLCLSSDGPIGLYFADDVVLTQFDALVDDFPHGPAFSERDFVAYVKDKIGESAINFVKIVGAYPRIESAYKGVKWHNF